MTATETAFARVIAYRVRKGSRPRIGLTLFVGPRAEQLGARDLAAFAAGGAVEEAVDVPIGHKAAPEDLIRLHARFATDASASLLTSKQLGVIRGERAERVDRLDLASAIDSLYGQTDTRFSAFLPTRECAEIRQAEAELAAHWFEPDAFHKHQTALIEVLKRALETLPMTDYERETCRAQIVRCLGLTAARRNGAI